MAEMMYVIVILLTIRQYAFIVRLDKHYFCSLSLSTNISGNGINKNHPVLYKKKAYPWGKAFFFI